MHAISHSHESLPRFLSMIKAYVSLTKPVAVGMIALVTGVGMVLAHNTVFTGMAGHPLLSVDWSSNSWLKLIVTCTLVGISSAGAFALNQYYERELDARMVRAKDRVLPRGGMTPLSAVVFGFILFLGPLLGLYLLVTPGCAVLTFLCGGLYVWAYTPLKTRSSMSTFVGAIPGALLPVMGWTAVRNDLDMNILFPAALLFIWQVPHALVIALKYKEDYLAAGMKQLPLIMGRAKSLNHLVFSTFMTGLLSFVPLLWVSQAGIYALGTGLILCGTMAFALQTRVDQDNCQAMSTFFGVHLISLPAQLVLFIFSL